ncbi:MULTISPECIES: hypothetical protein [Fusobacterium]|uniref:Uncharacterized protein n=1 Tax=Fusobacterium hominis TaxID=2764326 RepID=A0A7G9GXY1_9FUSO|nr:MULTISPECIES: hypothetical protein [Fusobacterium]QNM15663.1 hypothetical protein H9Q81_02135 [Fusobacterium hominis]
MEKKRKLQLQILVNTLVKLFLFPLFIVGMLLRFYDKIFKKNQGRKRKTPYNFWY